MSLDRRIRRTVSNADRLRELLDISNDFEKSTIDQIKSRHNFKETPQIDDLVRLIQSVESVNQQLLIENKYLKDETKSLKASLLNLVNENNSLHKELKNVTVLEILNEIHTNPNLSQNHATTRTQSDEALKEELHQSQLLINELQKKLESVLKTKSKSKSPNIESNTLENLESDPFRCCSKCNEELEIKIRQIDSLKNDIEQLNKSKVYLKQKCEDFEVKENDLLSQLKRYVDLVKHMELEKNQALSERELFKEDKLNSDKKFASILKEYDEKLLKEKEIILENVDKQIKDLTNQNQNLEERVFKQENLIDRLTRDKLSSLTELESYKQKCNSIDVDTHQMAEKLRNKYMDALRERDNLSNENKRVRHDYEQYVQQNDQDKFCLRNELNTTRNRLLEVEKDLISSQDKCIQLTEKITNLEAEIISLKHSKETVESSRDTNLKKLTEKFEEREYQLVMAIEALQTRYCVTVKELEELVESQKKLINNLRSELKICNEQLQLLAIKYKNDIESLTVQNSELNIRISRYETTVSEFGEQSTKHTELHDRMKERLKNLSSKCQFLHEELEKNKANETLMKSTNLQLMQEVNALKDQLKLLTIPTRNMTESKRYSQANHSYNTLNNMINTTSRIDVGTLNTVRSAIENSIYSLK